MFGQVPALFIDGVILNQSAAILRFIGRLSQIHRPDKCIYPKGPLEAAFVDAIIDHQADMFTGWQIYKYHDRFGISKDSFSDDGLADVQKRLNTEIFPRHLQFLEKRLKSSNAKKLWLANTENPTICDFYWAPTLIDLKSGSTGDANLLNDFPAIREYIERFNMIPEIFEYNNSSAKDIQDVDDPLSSMGNADGDSV
eukprot:g15068.t1